MTSIEAPPPFAAEASAEVKNRTITFSSELKVFDYYSETALRLQPNREK